MSVLRAAVVTPLQGPLAMFGRAAAAGLRLWAREAPGLPARWSRVELEVVDAFPDPAGGTRAAVASRPHLLFGPYGSGPTLAAARATGRLLWNHGGATSRLAGSAYRHVVNVPVPAGTYFDGALHLVREADPSARGLVLLHAETGFGRDVARGATAAARSLRFEPVVHAFAPGSAAGAAARAGPGDVLAMVGSFEDEASAAGILLRRSWRAAIFVGAGVDEVLAGLKDAREGLLGPAQWVHWIGPEPDEGPDGTWFGAAYRRASGSDPPYPAAVAFAAGIVAARCVRDAGEVDDASLGEAARALRCTTLLGGFRLDPDTGLQAGHEVLTVQWREGRRRVVWPADVAEAPFAYPRSIPPVHDPGGAT